MICFFALVTNFIYAQKIYFVYLQTENGGPFFIRMNDKLYSSTSAGYLILHHLIDSTYNFKLGFPEKNVDLDFAVSINKKDHGYLIKNFGDKGWGLFDLQSLGIQMSSTPVKSSAQVNYNSSQQVNAFTDMLSKATDDPSLKQNVFFAKEEQKKTDPVQTVQKQEKNLRVCDAVIKEEKNSQTTDQLISKTGNDKKEAAVTALPKIDSTKKAPDDKPQEVYKRSQVTRISEETSEEGIGSVFIDDDQKNKDTIRIFIPVEKKSIAVVEESKSDSLKENKKSLDVDPSTGKNDASQSEVKKEEPKKLSAEIKKLWPFNKTKSEATVEESKPDSSKDNKKSLSVESSTQKSNASQSEVKKEQPKKLSAEIKKLWPFNKPKSDTTGIKGCQTVAGNDDFLKLRRKMAERNDDDGMIEEAKKYFKTKCFTTEQIKNLSSMFLSSAGKYNFFKAAHNYVSDAENFSSLQSELKDKEYINRFQATFGN
jgi:hypothetical protein